MSEAAASVLIDLIRHGETVTPGRLIGRSDPPLSDLGRVQIYRQTQGRNWDAIVSSPRLRTLEPARLIGTARKLSVRMDDDWRELDFGAWDGRTLEELRADAETADAFMAFYRSADAPAAPGGGESWHMLEARVAAALRRLLDPVSAASTPLETALVVTHAGPIRAALSVACAIPFANLWTFRIEPGTRITLRVGRDAQAGLWGEIVEVVQP
ncbi:histidine phosphatase family protein [Hyphomicrobium sp. D-2]|uniref:histidine phosphatase family protein n=1 Tax=Hyphomicrobium sp. D-2 TaxID=3041621 RepID=UPI002454DCD9|nr:histidine phosphatase family protein [Hyphomicrobium sp. D-2]MDH4981918.1 histidine phosphatase family protein [Hyphomicrobium sp. D-2]